MHISEHFSSSSQSIIFNITALSQLLLSDLSITLQIKFFTYVPSIVYYFISFFLKLFLYLSVYHFGIYVSNCRSHQCHTASNYHTIYIFLPKFLCPFNWKIKKPVLHTLQVYSKSLLVFGHQNMHLFVRYNTECCFQFQNFQVYRILHKGHQLPND